MSFLFDWLELSSIDIKSSINTVLKETSIPQFPRSIAVKSLELGDKPPTFELLDIIDLNDGKFKGLFKFNYVGELNITLCSDMEINALKLIDFDSFTRPHFVLADKSTVIPVDFKIDELKVDSILTVVYNGSKITVVFKDEPSIDLNIETSIDELLDKELFELIKNDTLKIATDFLIQDLPAMIHKLKLLDDYVDVKPDPTFETLSSTEVEKTLISTINETNYTSKLDVNAYNTLSLKPTGFGDAVQRISLSQVEFKHSEPQLHENDVKNKKRRIIKMNKKSKTKQLPQQPITEHKTTASHSFDISSDDIISTSSKLHDEPVVREKETEEEEDEDHMHSSTLKHISYTSSPTLFDQDTSSNSLDEFESFALNDYTVDNTKVDLSFTDGEDPYMNLLHPMDILPSFIELQQQQIREKKMSFNQQDEKLIRPRGPSSNYINLNPEFKKFNFKNFKVKSDNNEEAVY